MDIVEEIRKDPENGAKRLVSEYKAGLLSLARRFCNDSSDAEELVNRTFAEVVANIERYAEQSAFFGWMCQILSNLHANDCRRKSSANTVYPGDVPDVADEKAQDEIFSNVDNEFLHAAIEKLPEDIRKAVVMHYFMEMPVREMARVLKTPTGTIAWRLHCARDMLAAKLGVVKQKPGGKALLLALALLATIAAGAAGVAAIRSAAPNDDGNRQQPITIDGNRQQAVFDNGQQPATYSQQPSGNSAISQLGHSTATDNTSTSDQNKETIMINNTRPSILAAALAAALPVASAFSADAGNFVWNGGFEESYIYWKNWSGNSNPYSLRNSEYGDINGIEARLEHWTGTGGIADKDASTAPKPNDTSLCSGERYLTIYKLQYVEQTLELPAAGTYEVSFRHCMRSGNSGHKIAVSLIDGTETAVFSSGDVSPGNSAGTYTGTATIAAAGRYRLRFEGTVDAALTTCIDDVAVALKDAASPLGAVDLKLPRYDRVLVKVRPLDYGQGDDLTQVDYRIAKHGQSFVPDWTAISAGLAKETEFAYLVTGLEIDTEYDLEVRFSAAGENFVAAKSFRTTKELLIDGGFDELSDFLSVSASLYKSVVDCNDCPWFGTGEVANRARASGGNISPSTTTDAKGLITGNVYAFIHTSKDLKQSITVPANGSYKVSFKYAASPNYSQDHSTAVEVVSEGGVTNTLFVESIENGDYTLHQCEREVTLPAGNMTFQLRGIPPDGIAVATCYDDISLQLVEANGNPGLTFSVSDESTDQVTLNLDLSARGAPDAIVDIAIAFAPTNQPLGAYYEPILSGLNALGNYSATIAGLDSGTTYACRLRVRNNNGGEAFVNGTFSTSASIIGNGGFEEGSIIYDGTATHNDLCVKNGSWAATTTVWKVNSEAAVYRNGIAKPKDSFTPNDTFTIGGYSGFIYKTGSFEQDIIVPHSGSYQLGFRYGLARIYDNAVNVSVEIAQNGVTNTVWSINNLTTKNTQYVPDDTIANLVKGPATFTIKQTTSSTSGTAGCYEDITLVPLEKGWVNEVVVASQNPAVTGGMKPAPTVFVDPAAGWATTFRADATWTDPSTGDKYTCTGWKLYRNGALINEKASLDCPYVHPDGVADDRIVWGWKPWAPGDRMLRGAETIIIIR